jgi:hypothetical protein
MTTRQRFYAARAAIRYKARVMTLQPRDFNNVALQYSRTASDMHRIARVLKSNYAHRLYM